MVSIIIMYAITAITYTLSKQLLTYTQPLMLIGIRMSIAGLLLILYQYFYAQKKILIQKNHLVYFVQIIIFTTYIPYALRFWAMNQISSSHACLLLYNTGPLITYLVSCITRTEKLKTHKIGGLVLGFCALLPLFFVTHNCTVEFFDIGYFPNIAIILSVASSSYGWIIAYKLITQAHYCPLMINSVSMLGGGILALITSWRVETIQPIADIMSFIALLTALILLSNIINHNLYAFLLKKHTPTTLSFASFITPLFTLLFGWLFLHEQINWQFWLSGLLLITSFLLFYKEETKHLRTLLKLAKQTT